MKRVNYEDTICALATGGGMSAIALIRISGNKSISTINNLFSKDLIGKQSHTVHFGNIMDKENIIDEVIVTIFQKNQSFTGEETVEISCHGSKFIQNKIIELLINSGIRIANPGEFSMRAFKNGKVDLSQAESIADLIESESEAAHKTAIQHLKGGFSKKLKYLREKLIDFASLIELELDFSEEDVEFANRKQLEDLVNEMHKEISSLIDSFSIGNVIKNGIPVAILGAPNVGKSSLINTLLNEDRAIVSAHAGTTRDTIEARLDLGGVPVTVYDTAGIREARNKIEKEGVSRSKSAAKNADIVLSVSSARENPKEAVLDLSKYRAAKIIHVFNKIDLVKDYSRLKKRGFGVSCKTKQGIDIFLGNLSREVKKLTASSDLSVGPNRIRHINHLRDTKDSLELAIEEAKKDKIDISADFIRSASVSLGRIVGVIDIEDVLDEIFSGFCIGK